MTTALKLGLYQHYKGPQYKVMHVATHSETNEQLVIYKPYTVNTAYGHAH